jgi:hypothetical protein
MNKNNPSNEEEKSQSQIDFGFESNNKLLAVSPLQVKRQIDSPNIMALEKKAPNDTPFLTHYKKPEDKRKTLDRHPEKKESSAEAALMKFCLPPMEKKSTMT